MDKQQPERVVAQSRAALPVPISVMVTTLLLVYCTLFRVSTIPVVHDKMCNTQSQFIPQCNLFADFQLGFTQDFEWGGEQDGSRMIVACESMLTHLRVYAY